MAESYKIDRLTARFASPEIEGEFRAFTFPGNFRNNQMALSIAVPFFGVYAVMDYLMLEDAVPAIIVRLAVVSVCAILLAVFRLKTLQNQHESVAALMVAAMGSVVAFIVTQDETLESSYYVGLIQGGVFLSFLLRLEFTKSILVLCYFLLAFVVAVANRPDAQQAAIQSMILATNLATCGFGIYLLQIYRRRDFEKTKLIARQNDQLNNMLANVRQDNARKVAAMNLLVHFVKTPVHQIVGFTDVIGRALSDQGEETPEECFKSVDFIKAASRELSQNVNRLLAYYRLDDMADQKIELVALDHLIGDYAEQLPSNIRVSTDCEKVAVNNHNSIICAALAAIVERYCDLAAEVGRVEFVLRRSCDRAIITVQDDGRIVSAEEFLKMARPLDKLDHYLSANGSSMPMSLRTAARAAQLAGGEFTYSIENGKNIFCLTVRDFESKATKNLDAA